MIAYHSRDNIANSLLINKLLYKLYPGYYSCLIILPIYIYYIYWLAFLVADSELEDLETPPRYRPDSLESLCKATRFTQAEIKRIYRGFKAECPTGVVKEDTFKMIYAQFFPQGGQYYFNLIV